MEALDELIDVFGPERVGIKISPLMNYNSMHDSDPVSLVEYLVGKFNDKRLAFVEVNEGGSFDWDTQNKK
jgi:N-ethylmaleimide reductase